MSFIKSEDGILDIVMYDDLISVTRPQIVPVIIILLFLFDPNSFSATI